MKTLCAIVCFTALTAALLSYVPQKIEDNINQSSPPNIQYAEAASEGENNMINIEITVNGKIFSASLYNNDAAQAFAEKLPLTLNMSEMNGNEKYYYLSSSLPVNPQKIGKINNGDLMLYGDSCVVLFYESFSTSYSYTPLGRVDNPENLAEALGSGRVEVTFKIR
ncbi:MAG: cyclophilin-like fold protein [Clostridia bacterium]